MTPFAWADYLALARRLVEWSSDEATWRTAVSRAYYACYGEAAALAVAHGLASCGVTHDRVWTWHKTSANPDGREINALGRRIKQARELADYKSEYPRLTETTHVVFGWADDLLTLLGKMQGS